MSDSPGQLDKPAQLHSPGAIPRSRSCREKGLTLVEMVTSMFLGGMVLLGLGSVYAYAIGVWGNTEAKLSLQTNGSLALDYLTTAAGSAETYSISAGKELGLNLPASPLDKTSRVSHRRFRLKEEALWMDDGKEFRRLIPAPGDSAVGVSDFQAVAETDPQSGILTLDMRVALFSRAKGNREADTMWFATTVHLRNRDLSGGAVSGSAGSASKSRGAAL
ncbi:MAG: prepilin-type N-terminal cleavage/methylation domain-containing protein [Fibrobacteria bacterium]